MLEDKMLGLPIAQMGTSGKYKSTPDERLPKKEKCLKSGEV